MASHEMKNIEDLKSNCLYVEKKDDKEDSVDYCIEELEKALENSKCDEQSDLNAVVSMNVPTFIVVDEYHGTECSSTTNKNSPSSLVVVDELLNELDSFDQDSSINGDLTVIHCTPQKCNDDNIDDFDTCNKGIDPIILSDTIPNEQLCNKTFVTATPNFINNSSKTSTGHNLIATSTPCRQNDGDDQYNVKSVYMPPARSILEKLKPLCFQQNQNNLTQDQGISDISAIECTDTPRKYITSNTLTQGTICNEKTDNATNNEFEEAFNNLYTTLFNEMDETNGKMINSNQKLKIYHDSIIKQHKQDNVKFNEIISEISSVPNKTFINVNENNSVFQMETELMTIEEEPDEFVENKTVFSNIIIKKEMDEGIKTNFDEENKINANTRSENDNECDNIKTEYKNTIDYSEELLKKETLQVPVLNDANKELTLYEEEALLKDDPDALSLDCSNINSSGPSTASSSDKSDRPPDSFIPTEFSSDSNPNIGKVFIALPEAEENKTTPLEIPPGVMEVKCEPPVLDRNAVFISDNQEENDDNNDPEWEHLRRLSNDKERYKALRERWHSIVIPDPNLDLTSQTFRKRRIARRRGGKNAIDEINSENNNGKFNSTVSRKRPRSVDSDDEIYTHGGQPKRRKLCTLIFEQNIEALMKKLEYKRFCILEDRDQELSVLAVGQEQEYLRWSTSSYNLPRFLREKLLSDLYKRQMMDVCCLRRKYEEKLKMAEAETEEYVSALNAATDEVLTFHKFYQDLDSGNNNMSSSMYLSDKQIQELIETEYMLDLYSQFYK